MRRTGMAARISGIGGTAFGRHEGADTLALMTRAANAAIADAGVAVPMP